jgi:hypothetical protein
MGFNQRTTTTVCSKPSSSTSNSYPCGKSAGAMTSICCTVIRPRDDGIPTDETTCASAVEAAADVESSFESSSDAKRDCVVWLLGGLKRECAVRCFMMLLFTSYLFVVYGRKSCAIVVRVMQNLDGPLRNLGHFVGTEQIQNLEN